MTSSRLAFVVLAALCCPAWLSPASDRVAEGNRLFHAGKFDDASKAYGQTLVDEPDSSLLNYNMGTANYKAGKYTEAIASFARAQALRPTQRRDANAAYNSGNAYYRIGAGLEGARDYDQAQTAYTTALAAYRRALGLEPHDQDAKFNYEFVAKKLEGLQEKMKEPEPPPRSPPGSQPDEDAQPQPQAGEPQEPGDGERSEDGTDRDEAKRPHDGGRDPADSAAGSQPDGQMSPEEAEALVDTARLEELGPRDFMRRADGAQAGVGSRDW